MANSISEKFWERSWECKNETFKKVLEWFQKLFSWELFKTKKSLDSLADDIIKKQLDFTDEKISEEEKKLLESIAELEKNDKHIENWIKWIDDIDDDNLKSKEKEYILQKIQEKSDNNNNEKDNKADLTDDEIKELWTELEGKLKICDNVLKTIKDDDSVPEDKKTKKAVLEAYNSWLTTESDIIDNLKKSTEEQVEQQPEQ